MYCCCRRSASPHHSTGAGISSTNPGSPAHLSIQLLLSLLQAAAAAVLLLLQSCLSLGQRLDVCCGGVPAATWVCVSTCERVNLGLACTLDPHMMHPGS